MSNADDGRKDAVLRRLQSQCSSLGLENLGDFSKRISFFRMLVLG